MSEKLHFINVGKEGTFIKSGDVQTVPCDVDTIIDKLQDETKLVIHFHGGLVNESKGLEIAAGLASKYQGAFPVTFVWKTGLIETLIASLNDIHEKPIFKKLVKWAIKRAARHLSKVDSRGPANITDREVNDELSKERPFEEFDSLFTEGARGGGVLTSEAQIDGLELQLKGDLEQDIVGSDPETFEVLNSGDAQELFPEDYDAQKGVSTIKVIKDLIIIITRVLKRFLKGSDHGIYPTVIEEILQKYYLADVGEFVWGEMKEAGQTMWGANEGLLGDNQHAGTYFLDKLIELQEEKDLVIDLVGHSAGSVVICELFKSLSRDNKSIKIRNVIFMAPALRYDLFIPEIVDRQDRFKQFRMYTMNDEFECKDILVPYVYTRSLLYFISGVLEGADDVAIGGMERYLVMKDTYDSDDYKKVQDYLLSDNRLVLSNSDVLSPDAEPPFICTAITHGGFDEDQATIDSVNYLLKQG